MCPSWAVVVTLALAASGASADAADDTCGPWSALLEDWATSANETSSRHGRILALPSSPGYYVAERLDGPLVPPPVPSAGGPGWRAAASKIVNRPPGPYRDKPYQTHYQQPQPQPLPAGGRPIPLQGAADRVDSAPQKLVSETDLFLLSAIEKLVYRVDLMEKRLRKMEEAVHRVVAGAEALPEPCAGNFTRVGGGCYLLAGEARDWKGASRACRSQGAALLELGGEAERGRLQHALLADGALKGVDWWTGGLNPGLLWIWSQSARPLEASPSPSGGEGRCLALAHDAARASYVYRGRDCSLPHRYICELNEDESVLSNEIEKATKAVPPAARPSPPAPPSTPAAGTGT